MTPYEQAEAALVALLAPVLGEVQCELVNSPKHRLPQVRSRCNILMVSSQAQRPATKSSSTQRVTTEFAANFLNADLHNHAESYAAIHALQTTVMGFRPLDKQGRCYLTNLRYLPPSEQTKQAWGYQVRFAFEHDLERS